MNITLFAAGLLGVLCFSTVGQAGHPQILVSASDREAIQTKIKQYAWAAEAYESLKNSLEPYVRNCQEDPNWLSSRLFMNWQTHYTIPICEKSRWIGGKGRAPVPTPRFGGARDWKTDYQAPENIEGLKPYNDKQGKVWLLNKNSGQEEWTDPGLTGRMFEVINERIIQIAADAAFIGWLEGNRDYARMAGSVLWTYMLGFSFKTSPEFPADDRGTANIIGMTSFEVIHEDIITPLGLCYDFLYDYLIKEGKDVRLIQNQLKRMIDRVVEGGFAESNWNLNQARIIAFGGLSLEDNACYEDGKGRPYYMDVVLHAERKTQRGIAHVIKEGYDEQTALWPEAPGYGFGTTADIVRIASLAAGDPAGQKVLQAPILSRAILAQLDLIYPNGLSCGVGDTNNTRMNTTALELLIAWARKQSDSETEMRLTAALKQEIDSGYYDRSEQAGLQALTQYVGELTPVTEPVVNVSRTSWAAPLNILVQRNLVKDPDHSLAASMFATHGGHVHANGLAMELYGAGVILGADPGRGSSYWQADHRDYYSQPPAHNTVIVNGVSSYPAHGNGHLMMRLDRAEPAAGSEGVSPNLGFAQGSIQYSDPPALQQRTLALVRTGETCGFYVDIFRSRTQPDPEHFHDYLYHNIGNSLKLNDSVGNSLSLKPSEMLSSKQGLLRGYDYFKNEKSVVYSGNLHGIFETRMPDGSKRMMDLWMTGQKDRRVFTVDAPGNRAARGTMTRAFVEMPMPTVLIRQQGDAWKKSFMAIYEPYWGSDGSTIQTVRAAAVEAGGSNPAACVVEGKGNAYSVCLIQDDEGACEHKVETYRFHGRFGVVILREGIMDEVYLGWGKSLGNEQIFIRACEDSPVSASLIRKIDGWNYSSTAPVRVGLMFPLPEDASAAKSGWKIVITDEQGSITAEQVRMRKESTPAGEMLVGSCFLPAGQNRFLSMHPLK